MAVTLSPDLPASLRAAIHRDGSPVVAGTFGHVRLRRRSRASGAVSGFNRAGTAGAVVSGGGIGSSPGAVA